LAGLHNLAQIGDRPIRREIGLDDRAHDLFRAHDPGRRKAAVEFVLKGLESGDLKPVIDRTFTFDEMVEVHRYLENNGQFGKIVVTL
jgi:NADPH:quinone reductase-like Zn-dependent oxidoreductase